MNTPEDRLQAARFKKLRGESLRKQRRLDREAEVTFSGLVTVAVGAVLGIACLMAGIER